MERHEAAQVLSVNVGLPRQVQWRGRTITTGIVKVPVAGPVAARRLNLAGDRQADLTVHGGPEKAIYVYPSEHDAVWRVELPDADLCWPAFGENLTTAGVLEEEVRIGDRFRVGSAELVVTQPRTPCDKLALRFDRPDMARVFRRSTRPGFLCAVAREGTVEAGDAIALIGRDEASLSVAQIAALFAGKSVDEERLTRRHGASTEKALASIERHRAADAQWYGVAGVAFRSRRGEVHHLKTAQSRECRWIRVR